MQLTPVVCDNPKCGTVWGARIAGPNVEIHHIGTQVGPCPKCGGMGHVPDGVYRFVGEVLQVLSAPAHSRTELERIAEILRQARDKRSSPAEIAAYIRREAPGLSKIADVFEKTSTGNVIALIAAALAAIQLFKEEPKQTITVQQVINNTIHIEAPKASPPPAAAAKSGKGHFKKDKRRVKKGDRKHSPPR